MPPWHTCLGSDDNEFSILSQIYEGNKSEPESLKDILERLKKDAFLEMAGNLPMIAMGRGISTKANLKLIKKMEFPYIVVERRAVEKNYVEEFKEAKETFEKITPGKSRRTFNELEVARESVYVKKVPIEKGSRVLCLSEGREKKEMAMDELTEQRFLNALESLGRSVEKGNIKLVEKAGIRVGRLRERYPSIAGHYDIHLNLNEDEKKVINISYEKKETR